MSAFIKYVGSDGSTNYVENDQIMILSAVKKESGAEVVCRTNDGMDRIIETLEGDEALGMAERIAAMLIHWASAPYRPVITVPFVLKQIESGPLKSRHPRRVR